MSISKPFLETCIATMALGMLRSNLSLLPEEALECAISAAGELSKNGLSFKSGDETLPLQDIDRAAISRRLHDLIQ